MDDAVSYCLNALAIESDATALVTKSLPTNQFGLNSSFGYLGVFAAHYRV